jgi:hypothetical protein
VWTHEFGLNRDGLRAELAGKAKAPTFAEILGMLPADKTVVVVPNARPHAEAVADSVQADVGTDIQIGGAS